MTNERRNQICNILAKDGINSWLIYKMTDSELEQSMRYDDYDKYNEFMSYLAYKYDI